MDLKALIAKMDRIEKKKILNESDKKESKKYKNQPELKEVDVEGKPKSKKEIKESTGSIYSALMNEFGLSEEGPGDDGSRFNMTPQEIEATKASLTPSQLKWLGGATLDKAILARVPKPLPGEIPGQSNAAPAAAPAAPAADDGSATDAGAGAAMAAKPTDDGSATDAGAGGGAKPAASASPAAPASPASDQQTIDPAKVKRFKDLLDKLEQGSAATSAVKEADNSILALIRGM